MEGVGLISSAHDRIGGSVAAFLAERSPLDSSLPLHVRIGALYAMVKRGDPGHVPQRLLEDTSTPELLRLHAAILLAATGEFSAVRFLLQAHARPSDTSAAEQALRNCDRFPLAVLAAMALSPPLPEEVLALPDELVCTVSDPAALLTSLRNHPTIPGRGLGVGVVINRPLQFDNGFRHTGFLILDETPPRILAFDMGDLLNRESASSVCLGANVLAAYSAGEDQKALLVYAIGGRKAPTDLYGLYLRTALEARGVELGVVAATGLGKNKIGCRIVTASGAQLYQNNSRVTLGNLCVYHPKNGDRPFFIFQAALENTERKQIITHFRASTTIDYGLRVRKYLFDNAERHEVLTRNGTDFNSNGPGSPRQPVYIMEGNDGRNHRFVLPDDEIIESEACAVVLAWITQNDDAWGASIPIPGSSDQQHGLSIRAKDGYVFNQSFPPGTLLRFVFGDNGQTYIRDLEFYLRPGCNRCLGVGFLPCGNCYATGLVSCPDCGGSCKVGCSDCSGTGKETCGNCQGDGRLWRLCPTCKGLPQLFVGNLNYDIDDDDLADAFGEYGEIVKAIVLKNEDGRSRGVGFVTFAEVEDSEIALQEMDETELEGRTIKVKIAVCKKCNGTKGKWESCNTCKGTGLWKCGKCYGSGMVPCGCHNGRVACTVCEGQRVVPCNCDLPPLQIVPREDD